MPVSLNPLQRAVFFTFNQGPGPLIDLWSAVAFRAVLAAMRLGIFDALAAGPQTVDQLANRLGIDPRGTALLLEALAALGYVQQHDLAAANTAMTGKWLLPAGQANFAPYLSYWGTILQTLYADLETSLRSGEPPTHLYDWLEGQPAVSADFQAGMVAIAQIAQGEIVGKLKLPPTARRVLDVGGGHAAYSIALCQRYPQLSATVFDGASVLASGRQQVAQVGLTGRIDFLMGDFLQDELPGEQDVVLLFNILHGCTPEQNGSLLKKAAQALCPGGRVVVVEQLADHQASGGAQAINALLALAYFHLLGGQVYRFSDIRSWMDTAGLRHIQRIALRRTPGSSLIVAERP